MAAKYFSSGNNTARYEIVQNLTQRIQNGEKMSPIAQIMASIIFSDQKDYKSGLMSISTEENNLECLSMRIQLLLALNRPDLAKNQLKNIMMLDEDSVISQLASIQYNLYSNSLKGTNDAFEACKELIDRFGASSVLLNSQAVALISQNRLDEAYSLLLEAFRLDSSDGTVLANIIAIVDRIGGSEEVNLY
ncbi:coatomer subunit epsilon-like [Octopus sinensis]|uniref:Coatomer subunit epsilon n=1 Tax=Octopus sinensis TaxID=2607531 RepID=A0A6P7U8N4_9MOLL|nr:coatomer subunit epsilon-like [Octopus sinensis]